MSTPFIAPITPLVDPASAGAVEGLKSLAPTGPNASTPAFGNLVAQGLEQVNTQLQASQVDLRALASGEAGDLHNVMIKLEQSRLSFQLMLQVRNRLLESYQEVMRMQV